MDASTTTRLRTGREMPIFGLGTWKLTEETADIVAYAVDLGYRMIDTAVDYGSQPGIGRALARTDTPREDLYLVAKVEEDDHGLTATRRYLAEMEQDYADLVLIHRPPREGVGEELWDQLRRARDQGLTRDIGVSNYSVEEMDRLAEASGEMPVVNQVEWTPFGWSADVLEACRSREVVIQGYSPLTRGERLDHPDIRRVADERSATPAQVLLRWCLARGIVPLPKANSREHIRENLGTFDVELDADDLAVLDALDENYSALGAVPEHMA